MRKSKLVQALRACEMGELDRLRAFVGSPYFNDKREVSVLLDYLLGFYPDFSSAGLTKRKAFPVIWPQEAYDDKRMRYLMSDLTKLVERFWVIEKQAGEPRRQDLILLECLSERRLEKGYRQINRNLEKEFESVMAPNHLYFHDRSRWFEIREQHFQRSRKRVFDANIQRSVQDLDRYYFLLRLRYTCAMLNRQAIFHESYDLDIEGEWVRHLQRQQFFDTSIIDLYFTIFQALQDEANTGLFTEWKEKLGEVSPNIPVSDLKDIYLFAINYCARKIRKGHKRYVPEALRLYQTGIEKGILIEDGKLSPWAFTNVVKLALSLQRYQWIEHFITHYAPMLPESFRDNALHYNLAELYYYTQRFDDAQEQLNQVEFSDLNYSLGARVLLAKIYYETGETEPLLSLLAAFIIFLKRNKQLSGTLKETYLNFCQLLYQLVRRNPRRLARLEKEIRTATPLTDRDWLLQAYASQTAEKKR